MATPQESYKYWASRLKSAPNDPRVRRLFDGAKAKLVEWRAAAAAKTAGSRIDASFAYWAIKYKAYRNDPHVRDMYIKARDNRRAHLAQAAQHVSQRGLDLIKEFEGCYLAAYQDEVGVWTIGYGHIEGVHAGQRLPNQQAALDLLRRDLDRKYEPFVRNAEQRYGLRLNQNQFDALVSFVYNLGGGTLDRGRSMGDAMANRDYAAMANAFRLYNRAGGSELPGLTRRRKAERDLFVS